MVQCPFQLQLIESIILTSHGILALKATQLERIHRFDWIQTCWKIAGNSKSHQSCLAQSEQNPPETPQQQGTERGEEQNFTGAVYEWIFRHENCFAYAYIVKACYF